MHKMDDRSQNKIKDSDNLSCLEEASSVIRVSEERDAGGYHDYKVISRHGITCLGTVTGFGRVWFVKSLCEEYRDLSQYRLGLTKEYDILLSLRRGPVADVISLCAIEGAGLSIVMEYVGGEHLDSYLKKASRSQRNKAIRRLMEAVSFIHARGVAHLDLKPENILVHGASEDPQICLIDFNLSDSASYTYNKEVGGNRRYAAPEQFDAGYSGNPKADVWSLGKLLKEFGAPIFWHPVISKALKENPDQRPSDASAMIRMAKKNRQKYMILILILIVAVIGTVMSFWVGNNFWEVNNKEANFNTMDKEKTQHSDSLNTSENIETIPTPHETQSKTVNPEKVETITRDEVNNAEAKVRLDNNSDVDVALLPYIKAHDTAIAETRKLLLEIEKELNDYLNNDSTAPKYMPALQRSTLLKRAEKAFLPLENLRRSTPLYILSAMPEEWATPDDAAIKQLNDRLGNSFRRLNFPKYE